MRPAITWLFGFVDSQLVMAEGLRPEACKKFLEEHHRAFGDVCTKVNGVLNASGDGLALCIWRALVALLTHFTGKVGPMTRRLRAGEAGRAGVDMWQQLLAKLEECDGKCMCIPHIGG